MGLQPITQCAIVLKEMPSSVPANLRRSQYQPVQQDRLPTRAAR